MNTAFQVLNYVITTHGYWAAFGLILILTIPVLAIVYVIFAKSSLGQLVEKNMIKRAELEKSNHVHGNRLRKQFSVSVQEILQDLAIHTGAERAILFEFSNGTTNLVGLPFLFMTAAAEVATPGLPLISARHQRLNTSLVAQFLIKLEQTGTVFINTDFPLKPEHTMMKNIMERADMKSALFCSIQGLDEAIGFLVIMTTNQSGKTLDLTDSVLAVNKAAQQISSMINYDEIEERERKNKKSWWNHN